MPESIGLSPTGVSSISNAVVRINVQENAGLNIIAADTTNDQALEIARAETEQGLKATRCQGTGRTLTWQPSEGRRC